MNRVAEIIYPGEKWTIVRFEGDICNSLVHTNDLLHSPAKRAKPRKNEKVEVNIYEIHLHRYW